MSRKKTHDEFIKEVLLKYGDEYSVISQYKKAHEKIKIKHNICGNIFDMTPANFLSGQGCPPCKHAISYKKQMITNKEFDEIIYKLVGDEYKRLSNYNGMYKTIKLKHNVCGNKFDILPVYFIHNGVRCNDKNCRHEKRSLGTKDSHEVFQEKFNDKSNGEYELLSKYHLSCEKVKIKHLECGNTFMMKPNNFLNGCKCPKCKNANIAKKLTLPPEEFIKKMNRIHGDAVSLVDNYINAHTKSKFICNKCGNTWYTLPSNITHKTNPTGCPYCKISQGERSIINFLDKNNILYIYQKKYKNLVGIGNNPLSYDFYLLNYNLLIEYQGKQHKEAIEVFGGEKYFDIQKEHDRRKRQYAKEHNIKFLEIWFWDFNNIEKILNKELGLIA